MTFLGQDDVLLTGNPEVTYFLEKYTGKIPFAQRVEKITFDTQIRFGEEAKVQIPKRGDLITKIYIKFNFPTTAIPGVVDSVGTYMIDYVDLLVNNTLVERLYGEYIEILNDITVSTGKQGTLRNLIGKVYPQATATPSSTYTIPLPFSSLEKGLDIPGQIDFRIGLRPSNTFTSPVVQYSQSLDISLLVEYTYLSTPLKRGLQLIEQVQRIEFQAPSGVNAVRCTLGFMNPVKELFVVIQNSKALGYDFTADGSSDQLVYLILKFSGVERVPKEIGGPLFLSVIQPMEYHTRVPNRKFYMYSFSLDPENPVPSGSINLSRISNQILEMALVPLVTPQPRNIRVYAVNYNFLDDGVPLFTNFPETGELKTGAV